MMVGGCCLNIKIGKRFLPPSLSLPSSLFSFLTAKQTAKKNLRACDEKVDLKWISSPLSYVLFGGPVLMLWLQDHHPLFPFHHHLYSSSNTRPRKPCPPPKNLLLMLNGTL